MKDTSHEKFERVARSRAAMTDIYTHPDLEEYEDARRNFQKSMPEFIYMVVTKWPDGTMCTTEHCFGRDQAFDAAGEAIDKCDCIALVYMIEFNDQRIPVGVSDVTEIFEKERIHANLEAKCVWA